MMSRRIIYNASPQHSPGLLIICASLFAITWALTIYFCHTMGGGMTMPGGWTMSMMWMPMAGQTWTFAAMMFMGMWISMMMAMMIPSLIPMLLPYREATEQKGQWQISWRLLLVGTGYCFIWTLFGIVLFPLGVALSSFEMQHPAFSRAVPLLSGLIMLMIGALQFTRFKSHQLACCRNKKYHHPITATAGAAWQHGLRLGIQCSRCCFGLMIILLLAGLMNLTAMFVVTAAITAERILPAGQRFAFINGMGALVAGAFMVIQAAIV